MAPARAHTAAPPVIADLEVNDRGFRLVMIPTFGIAIPNLTGLFGSLGPGDAAYWLGYAYFIALAAAIWQGNRWLLLRQRERLGWFDRPLQKIVILVAAITLYTAPLTAVVLAAWYLRAGPGGAIDWDAIRMVCLINVICVVFITHVYETMFLIKEREHDLVRVERLERARAEATLEALRAQIAPHFLFNSLNTLSHLIDTDPARARVFNRDLARVYRYILINRDRDLVLLSDEIEFVSSYVALLRIRFRNAVSLEIQLAEQAAEGMLIPPISLQLLVENAVKHNELDARTPMVLELSAREGSVMVVNPRRPRSLARRSAGLGLANLGERCRLIMGRELSIDATEEQFSVAVPVVSMGAP